MNSNTPSVRRTKRKYIIGLLVILGFAIGIILYERNQGIKCSKCVTCYANLQAIQGGLEGYAREHGHLPPAIVRNEDGTAMHSWRILILPYLGDNDIYNQYNFKEPWNGPNNRKLFDKAPSYFRCPFDTSDKKCTSYLAVTGKGSYWNDSEKKLVFDGPRARVIVLETRNRNICWLEPNDYSTVEAEEVINHQEEYLKKAGCNFGYFTWYARTALNDPSETGKETKPIILLPAGERKADEDLEMLPSN